MELSFDTLFFRFLHGSHTMYGHFSIQPELTSFKTLTDRHLLSRVFIADTDLLPFQMESIQSPINEIFLLLFQCFIVFSFDTD